MLVVPGEIAVGVALMLGLATRLTAAMALFMNINFAVMNGVVTAGGLIDVLFVALELALIEFASRQAFSADGLLARRLGVGSQWWSGMQDHRSGRQS